MEEWTSKKRRSVDLRHCFLYIWDHIVIILLVGVLLAGVLGGFRYFKVNKTVSQQQTFDSIVSQNRSNYYPTSSSDQTPNTESKKVDGSCIIRAAIFVDFDFSKIEGNSNSDFSSMVYRYQQDSIFRLVSDHTLYSIANEINSRSYDIADETKDLTGEDIRWLINVRITGANIIQFSVTDINTQRAMDIAEMLADSFIEQTSSNPTMQSNTLSCLHRGNVTPMTAKSPTCCIFARRTSSTRFHTSRSSRSSTTDSWLWKRISASM